MKFLTLYQYIMKNTYSFQCRVYGRTELAQLYSPNTTPQSAYNKLQRWIRRYPNLYEQLVQAGHRPHQREYTPLQVRLIVEALGEP